MESKFLFVCLILFGLISAQCLTQCMTDCCYGNGGNLVELSSKGSVECPKMPGCMVLYHGSIRGSYDQACMKLAGESGSGYTKSAINSCMGKCMRECGESWSGSVSPFSDGPEHVPPENEPEDVGPCKGVNCQSTCRTEDGIPVFYYDGQCIEDESKTNGYSCGYVRAECVWGCNTAGTNCADDDPLNLEIHEPSDGAVLDSGPTGYAEYPVTGRVSPKDGYTVGKVTISTSNSAQIPASFNPSTGRFSVDSIRITKGKPFHITATAYDTYGRRLATDSIIVSSSPKLMNLLFEKNQVTLWRNGKVVGDSWNDGLNSYEAKEGDTFDVNGEGSLTAIYSDGTTILLNGPFRIRFYENGIHLLKGTVEVDVKRNFEVLGKIGKYLVKGTKFRVYVPESGPEELTVIEGNIEAALISAPDQTVDLGAGETILLEEEIVPNNNNNQNYNEVSSTCISAIILLIPAFIVKRISS